jgi:hypothetical protein
MTARVARALGDGSVSVERAASMLHQPPEAVYRWMAESGMRLGITEVPL